MAVKEGWKLKTLKKLKIIIYSKIKENLLNLEDLPSQMIVINGITMIAERIRMT